MSLLAALLWIGACLLLAVCLRRAALRLPDGSALLAEALEAVLPQTQCAQCGYPGCAPYAAAVAAGESVDRCPPGGAVGVQALSRLVGAAAVSAPLPSPVPAPLSSPLSSHPLTPPLFTPPSPTSLPLSPPSFTSPSLTPLPLTSSPIIHPPPTPLSSPHPLTTHPLFTPDPPAPLSFAPPPPLPAPQLAVIREEECIGCAHCLPACPVDAILGAPGQLHSVLVDQCTGCGLCLAPCPVDCIEMRSIPEQAGDVAAPEPAASRNFLPPSDDVASPSLGVSPHPPSVSPPQYPCIRCGRCLDACPVKLAPQELLTHAARGDLAAADAQGLFRCLECGACDAVCPSRIPLLEGLRSAKQEAGRWLASRRAASGWRRRHQGHGTRQLRRLRQRSTTAAKTEEQRRQEIHAAVQRELARRARAPDTTPRAPS